MTDSIFVGARVLVGLLSFYAAVICIRQALTYRHKPARARRAALGAVIATLLGLIAVGMALRHAASNWGGPIPTQEWLYTGVAIGVALFFLILLASFEERDELERQLAVAAYHDHLTQLLNRGGYADQAGQALAACQSARKPATIAVIDIDHFKSINDGWGHSTGDEVLRGVARTLRRGLRAGDVLARTGGEEFNILLCGVTPVDAKPIVDRLRGSLTHGVPHPGAPRRRLTASAGLAPVEGNGAQAIDAATRRADAALYAAKGAGRNLTVLAVERRKPWTGSVASSGVTAMESLALGAGCGAQEGVRG